MRKSRTLKKELAVIDSKAAYLAANRFILENFRDRFSAGTPRHLVFPTRSIWTVPIVLAYPKVGVLGEVGFVGVDGESGVVVGWTPKEEVEKVAEQMYKEKKDEIEALFS